MNSVPLIKRRICIVNPGATAQLTGDATLFGGAEQRSILLSKIIIENKIASLQFITSKKSYHHLIPTISQLNPKTPNILSKIRNKLAKKTSFILPSNDLRLPEIAWDNEIFIAFGVTIMAYFLMNECKRRNKIFILVITSDDCLNCNLGFSILWKKNFYGCPRWIGYRLVTQADQIWVQTRSQEERLINNFQRTGILMPNPIPIDANQKISNYEDRNGVLWIGKSSKVKNPIAGLELAKRLPSIKFIFVLNTADEELEKIFNELKGDNVEVLNFIPRNEIPNYLSKTRLLINTSLYEGLPNTFLEAWANGTPVLSLLACNQLFEVESPPGECFRGSINQMTDAISCIHEERIKWTQYSKNSTAYLSKYFSNTELIQSLRLATQHTNMSQATRPQP